MFRTEHRKEITLHTMNTKNTKGFTLAELLIVVAIIAVLVAISIPIFTTQLHKAEVATDKANVRSYYAEIQADYMEKDDYNPKVPTNGNDSYFLTKITHLNGTVTKLKAGIMSISKDNNNGGYNIMYQCNKGDCSLTLTSSYTESN